MRSPLTKPTHLHRRKLHPSPPPWPGHGQGKRPRRVKAGLAAQRLGRDDNWGATVPDSAWSSVHGPPQPATPTPTPGLGCSASDEPRIQFLQGLELLEELLPFATMREAFKTAQRAWRLALERAWGDESTEAAAPLLLQLEAQIRPSRLAAGIVDWRSRRSSWRSACDACTGSRDDYGASGGGGGGGEETALTVAGSCTEKLWPGATPSGTTTWHWAPRGG
mmetsp:Transcript_15352/g.46576  ORF Transcript_15352/g.46576 Transcript_15352/m.46576 type:complete len:221 (-) Transcript_15352:206-868(-)